jgi:hypothetical protein
MDILFLVLLTGFFALTWKLVLFFAARDDC